MTEAAFRATYSDWKPVKTRRVIQIIFEVPWEQHDAAYQALGGMPDPGKERWFGIAKLNSLPQHPPGVEAAPRPAPTGQASPAGDEQPIDRKGVMPPVSARNVTTEVETPPPSNVRTASSAGAKRPFNEMSPSQQAGMLCQDRAFIRFINEKHDESVTNEFLAADWVRLNCNVKSRSQITANNAQWSSIVLAYRLWQREAEVVPA